jgi:hypothetical protein
MKKIFGVIFIFYLLTILCCDKEDSLTQSGINCKLLKQGLIQLDNELVKAEISKVLIDLTPKPSYFDSTGHLLNFGILFSRIEQCDNISCDLDCYCCLQTYPPISTILIKTDSSGIKISRTLYILTPSTDTLKFSTVQRD